MIKVDGIYEVAIRVKDLGRAESFYREVLGLEVGLRDARRPWVFMRAGRNGMIVLQEEPGAWPLQHFAFRVGDAALDEAAKILQQKGIAIEGPVFHEWIPARSVYFRDPDGHDLEICAPGSRAD